MAGIINLCMTDATGYGVFDYRFLNSYGNGEDIKVWSVLDMINKAMSVAGKRGAKIKNLYINGHGAPGYQSVGAGTKWDSNGDRSLQVEQGGSNWGQLKGVASWAGLGMLSEHLADDAMVTLSGCEVAAGADGKALLRAVAATMSVWVQAADAKQYAWIPGWEGRIWRCSPSGDILTPSGDYM